MEQDPKKLSRAHKIALGIISAACCCLIGVSAFALAAPNALEQLETQQETASEADTTQSSSSADGQTSEETTGNEAQDEPNSNDNAQSENNSEGKSSASSSQPGNSSQSNSNSSGNSGKASSSSSSSNKGNSKANAGTSSSNQGASTDSDTVTVSVSVSSSNADGRVSGSAHPTFKKGATAFDALRATGLAVTSKNSQYGIYVSAIGGLAEKEFGGSSGWMYSVNGSTPNVSCGKYKLKDGDSVSWFYVV